MKLWFCFLLAFSPLLHASEGGADAGNGGYGIVCRDKVSHQINFIAMHDLWWGESELDLTMVRSEVAYQSQIREKIDVLLKLDANYFNKVASEVEIFESNKQVLADGEPVEDPKDLFTHVVPRSPNLDRTCKTELIVNYGDAGKIRISGEVWRFLNNRHANSLGQTDLAAFYLHEAIYKRMRDGGENPETSQRPATIVAHIFSNLTLPELKNWYQTFTQKPEIPELGDDEIEAFEAIDGFPVPLGDFAAAQSSWLSQCVVWKKNTKSHFEKSGAELTYLNCGEGYSAVSAGLSVLSVGRLRFKPNRHSILIPEIIHGTYVSFPKDVNRQQAINSYERKCASWKVSLKQRYADQLVWAGCGRRYDQRDKVTLAGPDPLQEIGHHSFAVGSMVLAVNGKLIQASSEISGQRFRFSPATAVSAQAQAWESYRRNCEVWKQNQISRPGFLFATCEMGGALRDHLHSKVLEEGNFQFSSIGTYFRVH